MLANSGLLLRIEYKTAIVHPCDGLIPCNKPKTIIPDKTAKISCNYNTKFTICIIIINIIFISILVNSISCLGFMGSIILYVILYKILN